MPAQLSVAVGGVKYSPIISFASEDSSQTVLYPSQNEVTLSEGEYEITVNLVSDSEIDIHSYTKEECSDVPRPGFGGLLGLTSEECYSVEVAESSMSNLLVGGGVDNYYFLETELSSFSDLVLDVQSLDTPESLDELQENYLLVNYLNVGVSFE